jgi:hypothetical protein
MMECLCGIKSSMNREFGKYTESERIQIVKEEERKCQAISAKHIL